MSGQGSRYPERTPDLDTPALVAVEPLVARHETSVRPSLILRHIRLSEVFVPKLGEASDEPVSLGREVAGGLVRTQQDQSPVLGPSILQGVEQGGEPQYGKARGELYPDRSFSHVRAKMGCRGAW